MSILRFDVNVIQKYECFSSGKCDADAPQRHQLTQD